MRKGGGTMGCERINRMGILATTVAVHPIKMVASASNMCFNMVLTILK
jgi:hypothetical protein